MFSAFEPGAWNVRACPPFFRKARDCSDYLGAHDASPCERRRAKVLKREETTGLCMVETVWFWGFAWSSLLEEKPYRLSNAMCFQDHASRMRISGFFYQCYYY